jgi:hypothetical protein
MLDLQEQYIIMGMKCIKFLDVIVRRLLTCGGLRWGICCGQQTVLTCHSRKLVEFSKAICRGVDIFEYLAAFFYAASGHPIVKIHVDTLRARK